MSWDIQEAMCDAILMSYTAGLNPRVWLLGMISKPSLPYTHPHKQKQSGFEE